jgi:antirestriction protein ArdA
MTSFDLDKALVSTRRTYSRRVCVLLSTMSDLNDVDTSYEVTEVSEEFTAWRTQWDRAFDLNEYGAVEAFVDAFGMDTDGSEDFERTLDAFQEAYCGYRTVRDYAEDMVDESGELDGLSDLVRYNIDYDGIARDMICGGDFTENEGHLFRSNW